jgi:hypothetical protein
MTQRALRLPVPRQISGTLKAAFQTAMNRLTAVCHSACLRGLLICDNRGADFHGTPILLKISELTAICTQSW